MFNELPGLIEAELERAREHAGALSAVISDLRVKYQGSFAKGVDNWTNGDQLLRMVMADIQHTLQDREADAERLAGLLQDAKYFATLGPLDSTPVGN